MAMATDERLLQWCPSPSPSLPHGTVAADWVDEAAEPSAGDLIWQADGRIH